METALSLAIAGCLMLATVAFMISENRLTYAGIGGAAAIGFIDGQAIVDGVLLTVLASPLLLVLVPAGRRIKQRKALAAGADPSGTPLNPAQPEPALPPTGAAGRPASAPEDKAAAARREAERRTRAMNERMAADPVSAILRRQVPVRFSERPRSWLGGLPNMPEDVAWPTQGQEGRPLNFVAQIACADLPEGLWRGQGPREGWVLLFVDAISMDGTGEDTSKVIHIERLGQERQPPKGLAPVQDVHHVGAEYWQPQEDIPCIWRKWPIDIVEQHQQLKQGQVISFVKRAFAPRPTTSEELYGIKQAEDLPRLDPDVSPPRTWGAAADYLSMLILWAKEQAGRDPSDLTAPLRADEGWLERQIGAAESEISEIADQRDTKQAVAEALKAQAETAAAREAEAGTEDSPDIETGTSKPDLGNAEPEMPDSEKLAGQHRNALAWVAKLDARLATETKTLSHLQAYRDEDGEPRLDDEILASVADVRIWWASLDEPLRTMRDAFAEQDRLGKLPVEAWNGVTAVLSENMQIDLFQRGYRGQGKMDALRRETLSLGGLKPWGDAILREHYLDLYTTSPETRALIPEAAFEKVEEIARAISWGRPHRMGGLPDPLQDDVGPETPPLLFQIASDTGMNWMWGDAGTIFVHTSDNELAERRFDGLPRIESH